MKYLFILLFLFSSCSLKNTQLNNAHCKELVEIYNSDQTIREQRDKNIRDYQDLVLSDSTLKRDIIKGSKMRQLHHFYSNLNDLKKSIKRLGISVNRKYALEYLQKADSLYKIEKKVDSINLEKLIDFIRKYGYPKKSRFKDSCKGTDIRIIVWHHTKSDSLFGLIDEELKADRISKEEYDRITRRRKEYMNQKVKNE